MFHLRLHARVTFPTNRSAAPEDVGLWCGFRREQTWTQSGVQRSHRPQWDPSLDVPAASGRRLGVPQQMRCFSSEHFPTATPQPPQCTAVTWGLITQEVPARPVRRRLRNDDEFLDNRRVIVHTVLLSQSSAPAVPLFFATFLIACWTQTSVLNTAPEPQGGQRDSTLGPRPDQTNTDV